LLASLAVKISLFLRKISHIPQTKAQMGWDIKIPHLEPDLNGRAHFTKPQPNLEKIIFFGSQNDIVGSFGVPENSFL
jgi:hypothetical protein